jgi:hypothetical protein
MGHDVDPSPWSRLFSRLSLELSVSSVRWEVVESTAAALSASDD